MKMLVGIGVHVCVCVYMDECIYVSVNVYICTAFLGKAIMIDFFSHHDRLY